MLRKSKIITSRYSDIQPIGEGRWGKVYRATDKKSQKTVALKTLFPEAEFESANLKMEFKMLSKLKDPNIVEVYDLFILENGTPCYSMEWIDGATIREYFDAFRDAPDKIIEIAHQICSALSFIHNSGIVHSDIKPENILIQASKGNKLTVKLSDFGLAEYFSDFNNREESTLSLKGTFAYMSPELIRGHQVDFKSDLYSLGVILYEWVTGTNPFALNSLGAIISAHLYKNPTPPSEINPKIGRKLSSIILQLLAKEPSFRPSSAGEVSVLLNQTRTITPTVPALTSGMFVGQQLARKEIQGAFENACQGKGSLIVVEGARGIGKSRIIDDIKPDFQLSGAQVIEIFPDSDTHDGKKVFRSAFSMLNGLYNKISPRLVEGIFGITDNTDLYQRTDMSRLKYLHRQISDALLSALKAPKGEIADTPIVLVFKNFHCESHLPWLFFKELAFYWEQVVPTGVSFLWIIETRSEVFETAIKEPIAGRFQQVQLVPLTEDETGVLLTSLLNVTPFPMELTEFIFKVSQGNPGTIRMLAHAIHQSGAIEWQNKAWRINKDKLSQVELTQNLKRLFKQQILLLNEKERTVLGHFSLWTKFISIEELQITLGTTENLFSIIKKLMMLGLLEKRVFNKKVLYRCSNTILRKVTHDSIPAYERRNLHIKIADHLTADRDIQADEVAFHLLEGDKRFEGCEWASDAGKQFLAEGRHRSATKWFRIAIDRMPDRNHSKIATLSYYLAQSYYGSGEYDSAIKALEDAKSILDSRFYQKREKAKFLMIQGICYLKLFKFETAKKIFEDAIQYLPKTTAMDIRLQLLAFYCKALSHTGEAEKAISITLPVLNDLPLEEFPYFSSMLLSSIASAYFKLKRLNEAEKILQKAIPYGKNSTAKFAIVDMSLQLGKIYSAIGRYRDAINEYEKVISLTRKSKDLEKLGYALCSCADQKIFTSQPGDVKAMLKEAMEIGERIGYPFLISYSLSIQSRILISEGNLPDAEKLLIRAKSFSEQMPDASLDTRINGSLATIALWRGQWTAALDYYQQTLEVTRRDKCLKDIAGSYLNLANVYKHICNWRQAMLFVMRSKKIYQYLGEIYSEIDTLRAEIYLGMEDVPTALNTVKSALQDAKTNQNMRAQGYAHAVLGRIYHQQGSYNNAEEHLLSALNIYEIHKKMFEIGQTHFALGELYQTKSDSEKSKQHLLRAKEIFRKLGAAFFLDKVNNALGLFDKARKTNVLPMDPILETFENLTSLLNSITNSRELLEKILDVAIRFVNADRGLIFLKNSVTGEFKVAAARNLDESTTKDIKKISSTILNETTQSDKVLITGDAPTDPKYSTIKSVREFHIISLLCVPMKLNHQILGAIYVDSRKMTNLFSSRDSRFLQAFSNLAAVAISRSRDFQNQVEEKMKLKSEIQHRYQFSNMIGKSKIMEELFQRIAAISRTDTAVLITGSSGTGKELTARAIHYNSHRKNEKFVVLNCAAIPENLVESELFGYVKGAFTDAKYNKAGLFELADGGTVFLDEIGEMPLKTQAKLLRVIETKQITRVGSTEPRHVNIRIIAASNRNLRAEIQNGNFREDFYYRLRVAHIRTPDLRERKEDIPLLAYKFLETVSIDSRRNFKHIDPKAMEALIEYSWPGNVRELKNAIESAIVFGTPPNITLKDLPQEIRVPFAKSGSAYEKPELKSLDEVEAVHIRAIINSTRGNKLKACEILQISRPTLDRKLEKYNINAKEVKRKKKLAL